MADVASASPVTTTLTVMANLVGAGLLSLPYTLKRAGLVAGVAAMCGMCIANGLCMVLIAKCCDMAKVYNYKEVATAALGPFGGICVIVSVAAYTFGSCVSFIVLLGDFIPSLICEDGCNGGVQGVFARREVILPIAALLVLYPLSLMRNLNSLRFTSTLSTVCIIYSAAMIGLRCVVGSPPRAPASDIIVLGGGTGIFVSFPIMLVAFSLHYNVAKYYEEMRDRSLARLSAVTAVAFVSVLALYLATALGGYLLFGSNTSSDVLNNFENDDTAAIVARVALSAIVIGCYPLAFNSLRASVTSLLPGALADRVRKPRTAHDISPLDVKKQEDWAGHAETSVTSPKGYASLPQLDVSDTGSSASGSSPRSAASPRGTRTCSRRACLLAMHTVEADWPHALVTLVLVCASLGVALGVPNIATVLSYKGALGGSLIVFIFPGCMFFMLSVRRDADAAGEAATWARVRLALLTTRAGYVALITSAWGFSMMILGTLSTAGIIRTSS